MNEANQMGSEEPPRRLQGIPLVPEPSKEELSEREIMDYADHRRKYIKWTLNFGKDPESATGYSKQTAKIRFSRSDQFYRWVWNYEGVYTTTLTHEHVDEYMKELAYSDQSQDTKANMMKALKMLYRWRTFEFGQEEWEPDITFSNDSSTTNPKDYLSIDERKKIREAALQYGGVPAYTSLTPEERDKWKAHLAQRYGTSKNEIGPDEFKNANGWKFPSLFWTTLDAGLRPIEVKRATIHWIDIENSVLRIPKEESSKNSDNWLVSLSDRTSGALERWLSERDQYEKYDGRDELWLTRYENPYESHSLNRILKKLCEIAGIPIGNRDMSWYSIRHSVGTFMAREEGLAAAQEQLRHKSPDTTLRYDHAPPEDRRDALNKMG